MASLSATDTGRGSGRTGRSTLDDALRGSSRSARDPRRTSAPAGRERSLRLVAEVGAGDALLQILGGAEVLDDVAARVVEEDIAVLVAADGAQPLEIVPILEQIVDGLRDAAPGDDRDLGARGSLGLLRHASLSSIRIPPPFQCDTSAGRRRSAGCARGRSRPPRG